jgi:FtsP/CotA-like multicopper oxidase with cupredoxin domain
MRSFSHRIPWLAAVTTAALVLAAAAPPRPTLAPDAALIQPNDNRMPAGRLTSGVLVLRLEARAGVWEPKGPGGPRLAVAAFAEPGGPRQTPGPLVRVTSGTEVRASVRNTLAVPLYLYGMGATRGIRGDSVEIAPGATRELRFRAGEAGTYYYAARTVMTKGRPPRTTDDSQLHGAIVVHAANAPASERRERVFVISEWFTEDSTTVSGLGPGATLAINGREWPGTERLDAAQGDTLRWRIVNATILEHPMHLHGFYYTVLARGDHARDTTYAPADRRSVVTEVVLPGRTMRMEWVPTTSGNWIFHCHFASHIMTAERLEMDRRMPMRTVVAPDPTRPSGSRQGAVHAASHAATTSARASTPDDAMRGHMAGLVLGVRVRPRGAAPEYGPVKRALRLEVRSKAAVYGEYVGYSYVLGGSPAAADRDTMPIPGPMLVLNKDERVAITIVNRSHEPAAVHWHGIELESFADGVAGWSGAGKHTLPFVEPGDSLTVRFTPPRAGTFMYHSHSNEMQQISSGLYGAIIVVDPAAPRDTARERLLLFSDDGPTVNFFKDPPPAILLNGQKAPAPLELRAGVTYRLRLINIRSEALMDVELLQGDTPVEWRTLAVDGADVPAAQAQPTPARLRFASGQIRDVEFTPRTSGTLTLRYVLYGFPPAVAGEKKVPVIVRD